MRVSPVAPDRHCQTDPMGFTISEIPWGAPFTETLGQNSSILQMRHEMPVDGCLKRIVRCNWCLVRFRTSECASVRSQAIDDGKAHLSLLKVNCWEFHRCECRPLALSVSARYSGESILNGLSQII
jgi:hypothetical protein